MVNFDGPTHLLEYINLASEDTIFHTLAHSLLEHEHLIAESTITEMADLCFVSAATLSRFCKKLEYQDYAHFKESFTNQYAFERDYTASFLEQMKEHPEHSIRSLSEQIQDVLADCAQKLDFEVVDKILKCIHECDHVAFFSSHLLLQMASDIQQRLQKLGKLTYAFTRITYQNAHIKDMDEHSLAIFISVNGGGLLSRQKQIQELKKRNVPIILITQNPHTILERDAAYTLLMGGNNHNDTGRFCVMYILEALLIRYYQLYGRVR